MTDAAEKTAVIWLTGLPCAGKSSLAQELWRRLALHGSQVEYLDGDLIREKLPGIGFAREERESYLRHVGFTCSVLEKNGITVIASFVSPYRSARDFARTLCRNFVEVYVSTPLEECERRDSKGMYAKARRGELPNFTGVDDPYEAPLAAEITLDTTHAPVEECAGKIMGYLIERRLA